MNEFRPNFFIIGASKCGTSALADALKIHPDIFMSERKEPNFFNKFDPPDSIIQQRDFERYAQNFNSAKNENRKDDR